MDYFTMKEVEKHNTTNDTVWIIINDTVYDITSYISKGIHPGGNEVFDKYAGTDATNRFTELHSKNAWLELEQYKIGYLKKENSIISKLYNTVLELF